MYTGYKLHVGFKSEHQQPALMIIREHWVNGKVVYAEILHKAETVEDIQPDYVIEERGPDMVANLEEAVPEAVMSDYDSVTDYFKYIDPRD